MTFGAPYVVAVPLRAEVIPEVVHDVVASFRHISRRLLRSYRVLLSKQSVGSYQLLHQDKEV